jgi:hypothetical protein
MDITTVFGTVVGGSSPSGSTRFENGLKFGMIIEHLVKLKAGLPAEVLQGKTQAGMV